MVKTQLIEEKSLEKTQSNYQRIALLVSELRKQCWQLSAVVW